MSKFKLFLDQFFSQLEQANLSKKSVEFENLLHIVEPEWEKEDQEIFVEYCVAKAGIFALFGENLDMDHWMQKAVQFSDDKARSDVYFKWVHLYWSQSKAVSQQAKLQAVFSSLFNVSEQALKWEKDSYQRFAFSSIKAFSLAALGKHAEVKQELEALKWRAIPSKLTMNKAKLKHFYSHIYKMLIAAVEIRDEILVLKILQMITIDDTVVASPVPLFRKLNTVVMDIADLRTEFANDFNNFYQLRKKWAGFLPNFSLFTMMIEEANVKGLDLFFKGMN